MDYYKVAIKDYYGSYYSCMTKYLGEYSIIYEIGKLAIPKIGKIYAFKEYRKAYDFALRFKDSVILRGKGKPSRSKRGRLYMDSDAPYLIKRFWKKRHSEYEVFSPDGTVLLINFLPESEIGIR